MITDEHFSNAFKNSKSPELVKSPYKSLRPTQRNLNRHGLKIKPANNLKLNQGEYDFRQTIKEVVSDYPSVRL
jgi:hypothetical protein